MNRPTRRDVLWAGSGLALAACVRHPPVVDAQSYDHARTISFSPEAMPLDQTLFPQTVSASAMRTDSARLWTRTTRAAPVGLRVWRYIDSNEVALVHEEMITPPDHGNVIVRVEGLAPATWYHYAFFPPSFDGARSQIGRFQTAWPDDWKEPLTVGATSCASWRHAPWPALQRLSGEPLDLWLHLGDVSYNDDANTVPGYRTKWQTTLADPGYRALMPSAGGYLVWDDHDFYNNFDAEAVAPGDPIIAAAKQTWFETIPDEQDEKGRIWRSYRWGATAEFFLLDCRTERKESTRLDANAQFLSREQMDWLKGALKASPCHFKVVMTSVPMTVLPPPLWGGSADRWEGYPAARNELLDFLDTENVSNVWFVTGDVHLGLVMRLEKSGDRSKRFEIAAGPAGNVNPLAFVLDPSASASDRNLAFPPEQFLFAYGGFSATTLTFDPVADTVRVVFIDGPSGQTKYDEELTTAPAPR